MKFKNINWEKCSKEVLELQRKIIVAYTNKDLSKVFKLQETLINTFSARAIAVKEISTSVDYKMPLTNRNSKRISGIDNIIWNTDQIKMEAINSLKNLKNYSPLPLKQYYFYDRIRRNIAKLYPTLYDRAVQYLYYMALDPISEIIMEERSYGFRLHRSIQDVQQYIRKIIGNPTNKRWIMKLEAIVEDPKTNQFNDKTKEWFINNIPMNKKILNAWLNTKSYNISKGYFLTSILGRLEKGIMYPLLINLLLNGIESVIQSSIKSVKVISEKGDKLSPRVHYVRYNKDFLITGDNPEILNTYVIPAITKHFNERGITFKIKELKNITEGFDFYGFNFRKYKTSTRANQEIFLIHPSKLSLMNIKRKIHKIIKLYRTPLLLILRLNALIKNWAEYYENTNSKRYFNIIDSYINSSLFKWVKRKHHNSPYRKALKLYFKTIGGRNWRFLTKSKGKTYLLNLCAATKIRNYILVINKNPYLSENNTYYTDRLLKKLYLHYVDVNPLLAKVFKNVKGLCSLCSIPFKFSDNIVLHYVIPLSEKGKKTISNTTALHSTCKTLVDKNPLLLAKFIKNIK